MKFNSKEISDLRKWMFPLAHDVWNSDYSNSELLDILEANRIEPNAFGLVYWGPRTMRSKLVGKIRNNEFLFAVGGIEGRFLRLHIGGIVQGKSLYVVLGYGRFAVISLGLLLLISVFSLFVGTFEDQLGWLLPILFVFWTVCAGFMLYRYRRAKTYVLRLLDIVSDGELE